MMKPEELSKMSASELADLVEKASEALELRRQHDKKEALIAAQKAANEHGFDLSDLLKSGKKNKSISPPKFRNPHDELQTWTGRGKQPDWFKAALREGHDKSSMAI